MNLLGEVARLVYAQSGIVLRESQYPSLRDAIRRAAGTSDPAAFLRLAGDPLEGAAAVARLIEETTVQETYFLREREQLEAIDWHGLAARSGVIRIWDTACATGEEAYTLALLATEAFGAEPPVRIVATDISAEALARARAGEYGARSVREVGPALRKRYFEVRSGGGFRVGERLRRLVTFSRHNLVRDPVPPAGQEPFDLIVCRNVLIYFGPEIVARLMQALDGAVRPGGSVLLGAADVLCVTAPRLGREPVSRPAKARRRAPAARKPAPAPPPPVAPLDAEEFFVRGVEEVESERLDTAIAAFRSALYVDPSFALAAFELGRAYEAAGDRVAARRSYSQALKAIDPDDERHEHLLGQVDLNDVAAACSARLATLNGG
jgi:chemotaxis protein methyltransferase CheR